MIISCPDKFFVPIVLVKSYREVLDIGENNQKFNESLLRNYKENESKNISRKFLEDKIIDYNINEFKNVSRRLLEDKKPNVNEIEEEIYEGISNIGDEDIEYYILKYVTAFMVYESELEAEGCTIVNRVEFLKQIQLYVQELKELYNEFTKLKNNLVVPLSLKDQKGIEDYFVEKIKNIYDKQLTNIKCNEKGVVIDNNIEDLIEETRKLIKREIDIVNQELLNVEKNKVIKDENYFKNLQEIYDEIDKEN